MPLALASYSQQEELYEAIYTETSAVNRLLEEAECALAPADAAVVAWEVRRHLTDGAWAHQADMAPAEVLAAEVNASDDAGAPPRRGCSRMGCSTDR
jgi:hypothetical protein